MLSNPPILTLYNYTGLKKAYKNFFCIIKQKKFLFFLQDFKNVFSFFSTSKSSDKILSKDKEMLQKKYVKTIKIFLKKKKTESTSLLVIDTKDFS